MTPALLLAMVRAGMKATGPDPEVGRKWPERRVDVDATKLRLRSDREGYVLLGEDSSVVDVYEWHEVAWYATKPQ